MTRDTCLSVVIPTYQREQILLDTISHLLGLKLPPAEIIVIDQTSKHEKETAQCLNELEKTGRILRICLPHPSIPHAMNVGLLEAKNEIVLFLDDDIVPGLNLVSAHAGAHARVGCNIVAGQILQPGEEPVHDGGSGVFRFCADRCQLTSEFMGGNFSIKKKTALELGGFDENFVHVAYRFEADFSERAILAGEKILFEPDASIRHLKAERGGTRAYGEHLKTIKPGHSVGEYYYLMRSKSSRHRLAKIIFRPLRAVSTRHHLLHPWWIPVTLISELLGFLWALGLFVRGPKYNMTI